MAIRKPLVLINGEKQQIPDTDSVPNADKLDGKASTYFATAVHTHMIDDVTNLQTELNNKSNINHNHDDKYLGKTEKAVDADKLDGNDSTYFATATNLTSHTSNTNNPHNVTAAQLGAANILTQIKTVDGAGSELDADLLDGINSTDFSRCVARANATVGPGWMTIAENTSGRWYGEVYVSNSAQSFIRISWLRSYRDSSFIVVSIGGHSKTFTGVRVLSDNDISYGKKKLQVYTTLSLQQYVSIWHPYNFDLFNQHNIVTPIIQNEIEGYTIQNIASELTNTIFATSGDIKAGGNTVWHAGNLSIVGTVSQSGGVPTGAIIERGSNANGEYTKFADGTQIVTNFDNPITTSPVSFTGTITKIDNNKLWIGRWY